MFIGPIDRLAEAIQPNGQITAVYEQEIEALKALSLAQIARALTRIAAALEHK